MPQTTDPPANIALYNYSDYLSPAYADTDFFDSWQLNGSGYVPPIENSPVLYNFSDFFVPGFFESNYFNSLPYDNQSYGNGSGIIVINMTSLVTPEFTMSGSPQFTQALIPITLTSAFNPTFEFTSDNVKNFNFTSVMYPTFSGNTQMVNGIVFGSIIASDFRMNTNTAVLYNMTNTMNPTFTFTSPSVGKSNRKSFTLAIDRGYFMARQGHYVLNFYVMAR